MCFAYASRILLQSVGPLGYFYDFCLREEQEPVPFCGGTVAAAVLTTSAFRLKTNQYLCPRITFSAVTSASRPNTQSQSETECSSSPPFFPPR